jgi:hypothetical protein
MNFWVFVINAVAVLLCTLAFVIDVIVGNWTMACVQLALASSNFFFAYMGYMRYKDLKGLENDNN